MRPWTGAALVLGAAIAAVVALPDAGVTEGQRALLAAVGAALVLLRWALRARASARAGARLTAAVVVWAGLALGGTVGADLVRVAEGDLNLWSHYHYLLNAKYFPELGYTRLYEQTVAAARERPPDLHIGVRRLRDLETYDLVKAAKLGARIDRDPVWTDTRWATFRADLVPFAPHLPWDEILFDRGYNATPTGNALYRQLARVPFRTGWLQAVSLLDSLLLVGAFAAAGVVFGPVRALVAAAWLALLPGNEHRLVGVPLQYDWLAASILTACAWRRGWAATAGALLAYAAMVRVFPGLLVAGLVVWAAGRWRAGHGVDRGVLRFCAAFVAACAALAAAGSLSARGPAAWAEWEAKLSVHSAQHVFGERRLGLKHLFTYTAGEDGDWPSTGEREQAWHAQRGGWLAIAALGTALWLAGGLRGGRRGDDPLLHLALALWLVFAGVVVSRYYGSAAVLFVLLGRRGARGGGEPLTAGLLALVALHALVERAEPDPYGQYLATNTFTLVAWAAVLLWHVAPDLSRPPDRDPRPAEPRPAPP